MSDVKKTIDTLAQAFEDYKSAIDAKLAAAESGHVPADLLERVEANEKGLDEALAAKKALEAELKELAAAQESLELAADRDSCQEFKTDRGTVRESPEQRDHRLAFARFIRAGMENVELRAELRQHEIELQQRAVLIGTPGAGGYAVPEVIARRIMAKAQDESPFLSDVDIITVGTSDYKELVDVNGEDYGWVGEGDPRDETSTSQLAECAPSFGTIYARPKASEEALLDLFFDVESWLVNKSGRALGRGFADACVSGNGTNKPTGFLSGTPVTDADGSRTYGVPQYFPTGQAGDWPASDPSDVLLDLVYGLKAAYRAGARWRANSLTLKAIRKFKDGDGDYIWRPGLALGQPDSLLGYAISEDESMPDIAANSFSVAFGNWREAYLAVRQAGLRMNVDAHITSPGHVIWYVRQRVGGKLRNDDSIKLLKFAAT